MVFQQILLEKACFISKMPGLTMVRPASSDLWKAPLGYVHTTPGWLFVAPRKAISYSVNIYPHYVTLLFRDRRGAASLRHRNRATTVLVCEQKPQPV